MYCVAFALHRVPCCVPQCAAWCGWRARPHGAWRAECIFMTYDVIPVHVAELCLVPYVTKGKSIIIATPTDTPARFPVTTGIAGDGSLTV